MVPKPALFWKLMIGLMLYSVFVLWFDDHYFPKQKFMEANGVMITSVVMGLLLAFRTNSAYDRWWEGRKLWGQLVNDIRNLCLKSSVYLCNQAKYKQQLSELLIAFPYILKNHLRGTRPEARFKAMVPDDKQNAPLHVAQMIFATITAWKQECAGDGFQQLLLDPHARALMDITGSCERILKSPISPTYKDMIFMGLGLYLLALPWLLVPTLDLWSLPVMFIGSYFAITLELLAEETEEPFGTGHNDLPLDSICQTIEASVRQELYSPAKSINESNTEHG